MYTFILTVNDAKRYKKFNVHKDLALLTSNF